MPTIKDALDIIGKVDCRRAGKALKQCFFKSCLCKVFEY